MQMIIGVRRVRGIRVSREYFDHMLHDWVTSFKPKISAFCGRKRHDWR
jgi:hypothetical protein